MKLSETANEAIALAEAIRSYWDRELPKRHPHYPVINPGEDDGPPPPEEKQLKELLSRLPPDDIYKLVLIMCLGRGDFGVEDLAGHYEDLKSTFAKPEWAIAQMMGKAPLADYLTDGLAELSNNHIDLDTLQFASARSGS